MWPIKEIEWRRELGHVSAASTCSNGIYYRCQFHSIFSICATAPTYRHAINLPFHPTYISRLYDVLEAALLKRLAPS